MDPLAFVGGTAILPDDLLEDATLVCRNGLVERVDGVHPPADAKIIDAHGCFVAPGYVDLHVHGGDNADFMDGTVEAVRTVCKAHLRHGTTTIVPTSTTGSEDQLLAMIEACRQVASEEPRPRIPGIHLYGPYFAEDKVGCHSLAGCRPPQAAEYDRYFESGFIKIATCAAELPGAQEFYGAAAAHQCFITCGHSNSSWAEMQTAYELGMRHVDHFWCAMSSVPSLRQRFNVPMQASMAEFVLMHSAMSTEVIADGQHLAPELLEFAYRMLGPGRLCLVTDCNRALDMPVGDYRFGNLDDGSWFRSDGKVGWAPDGESLASSVVGMDHMVRHMHASTSASLPEVIRMASLTPAQRVGLDDQIGSLEVGKQADVLVLDQELRLKRAYVGGDLVFCNEGVRR